MKILRIVSSGYPQGGAENGIVLTNEILRSHGHSVRTISSNVKPERAHFSDYEFAAIPERGIKKIIYGTFNYDAYRVTRRVLREFKPDIVLLHTMGQPTAAVLFLLKRYPTVLMVHGPEVFTKALLPWFLPQNAYKNGDYDVRKFTPSGKLRYFYLENVTGLFYRIGFRNVDEFVGLSNYTRGILEHEGYPATYFPNGASMLPTSPLQYDPPVLLYVGRLEKFKGVDDVIRAMPAILRAIPTAQFRIVGEGDYGDDLKKLVKKLKLERSVQFVGHVNSQQLAKEYRSSTLFVLPSTWPETFGKVGIEAMSVGRPVIAADVGGIRDWLQDGVNGFLVRPHSPEQIAQQATRLLSDENLARKMAQAAQSSAQNFSIELMAENIEKLLARHVC